MLRRRGDGAGQRDAARNARAPGHHPPHAGRVRRLLHLSPPAREAHRGHRSRHRMVEAPGRNVEMTEWLGLPPLATAHGGQIDNLIGWIHIFMFILFVGWGGFFLFTLVRFRKSRNPVADYKGVTSHRSTYVEVGVAVIEGVLLIGFAIPLWAARVDSLPPENEALVVQVTGEQFAWNVHYPGPDRTFGRTDIKLLDLQSNPLGLD